MTNNVQSSSDVTWVTVMFAGAIIMLIGIAFMPGDESSRFFQTSLSAIWVGGISFVISLLRLFHMVFTQCEQGENSDDI